MATKCEMALQQGPKPVCADIKLLRRYVVCKTLQKVKQENKTFGEAMRSAWAEAKSACKR